VTLYLSDLDSEKLRLHAAEAGGVWFVERLDSEKLKLHAAEAGGV
jgi:hypothetical protein